MAGYQRVMTEAHLLEVNITDAVGSRASASGAFSRTNSGRPSSLHHEQMTFIESSYAVIPGSQQKLRQWLCS